MNKRIKRGFGLIVVAVMAWFLEQALIMSTPFIGGPWDAIAVILMAVTGLALLGGLGLIAWSLLRD